MRYYFLEFCFAAMVALRFWAAALRAEACAASGWGASGVMRYIRLPMAGRSTLRV